MLQPALSGISQLIPSSCPPPQTQTSVINPGEPMPQFPRNGFIGIPTLAIPGIRLQIAKQAGVHQRILMTSYAGLGDQVCAEPTLRFALENLKEYEISLAAHTPSLFQHLKFKKVYHLMKEPDPKWEDYNCYNTVAVDKDFAWDFLCGLFTHCVDFASLCAFRMTLPIEYKQIKLVPSQKDFEKVQLILDTELKGKEWLISHPGAHWQSKTWPAWWHNRAHTRIKKANITPVLIGATISDHCSTRGTVDVDATGCLDLRGKLSIMESVALIQRSKVVLTNDSAPLHMAASSDAWIGFISIAKHPDYLLHYRNRQMGYRMQSLGLGGVWEIYHPLSEKSVIDIGEIRDQWLPLPENFADWGISKIEDNTH